MLIGAIARILGAATDSLAVRTVSARVKFTLIRWLGLDGYLGYKEEEAGGVRGAH